MSVEPDGRHSLLGCLKVGFVDRWGSESRRSRMEPYGEELDWPNDGFHIREMGGGAVSRSVYEDGFLS